MQNKPHRRPVRSVDGMRLPRRTIQPTPAPRPGPRARPVAEPIKQQQPAARPAPKDPFWKKTLRLIGQTALFLLFLALAFIMQSPLIGQVFVLIYAVVAFVRHINSRTTFVLVLGCFGVMLYASARSDVVLASTFATYAFMLLVVATISLALEVRSEI
jgi:hypothetical protein